MKTIEHFENEQCWVLVGKHQGNLCIARRLVLTSGQPTTVEFDPDWVIRRDESWQDVVGFLHTHPSGNVGLSRRDIDTMQAWTSCLGRPLLCLIAADDKIAGYQFEDDECTGQLVKECELFSCDRVVVCK